MPVDRRGADAQGPAPSVRSTTLRGRPEVGAGTTTTERTSNIAVAS